MSDRSPSRVAVRAVSFALVAGVGCVGTKDVARGNELAILHGTVDERLGAGSTELFGSSERGLEEDAEARAMTFESFPTSGGTLMHVSGKWSKVPFEAFALQTATGIRPLPLPASTQLAAASDTSMSRFAVIDDGAVYARCNTEGTSVAFLLPHANDALVAMTAADATRLCAVTIGKSSQPGRIATAAVVGEKIVLSSMRIDASGVFADGTQVERTPTGQPAQTVFSVEERSPGTFLYAATVTGLWVHEQTDEGVPKTTTALEIYPDPRQVRHTGSGALQVFFSRPSDRYVEWQVQGDGTVKDLNVVAPPDVAAPWRLAGGFAEGVALLLTALPVSPNSSADPVLEPTEARARIVAATGDALEAKIVPASPCVVRAACREVGESYFLGVSGEAASRVGVYLLWGWRGAMTIVATPLADRATP